MSVLVCELVPAPHPSPNVRPPVTLQRIRVMDNGWMLYFQHAGPDYLRHSRRISEITTDINEICSEM